MCKIKKKKKKRNNASRQRQLKNQAAVAPHITAREEKTTRGKSLHFENIIQNVALSNNSHP